MKYRFMTLLLIMSFCFALQGCETFKGAANGLKKDVQNVKEKKGFLYDADDWLRENLW